ncbi:hypothetical protein ADK64_28970 [Streptomyces sp. MMG1121]|nr:hypothetical protein ADK64_28970 [Streptomyces sp. MMG1121]
MIIAAALAAAGASTAGISDILVTGTVQQRIAHAVRHKLHPSGAVTFRLTDALAGLDTLTATFVAGLPAAARLTSARPDHTGLALHLAIPPTSKLIALPGGPGTQAPRTPLRLEPCASS